MKVHLRDGSFYAFGGHSATLAGDNLGQGPADFEWSHTPQPGFSFYTDVCLPEGVGADGGKVAWLIEPPRNEVYEYDLSAFDYVLTYSKAMLEHLGGRGLFYPFGGSWLDSWNVSKKTRNVSLLTSAKNERPGHKLRHQAARLLADAGGTVYGEPYTEYLPGKADALRPFRYSIIIENERLDWWFTEKLIDCFSQGTVPIYWGCPDIGRFFDELGIIPFRNMADLTVILDYVDEEDYGRRLSAIRHNFVTARQYICAEDYIYREYPFLFPG